MNNKITLMKPFFLTLVIFNIINLSNAQTALTKELDDLLVPQFKSNEPGGVVMVAKNDSIIYEKAFGMANIEINVATNDSLIYCIGSNTKQFTAVAILQLVEKSKLQLQDTLGKFVPLAPAIASGITVQQLLSQTSGIDEKNELDFGELLTRQKLSNISFTNYPGTKWEYNNYNYSVLGFIIEKVSGQSYSDYIVQHIFKVAGMAHSYVDDWTSIIPNRASGYKHFKTKFLNSNPSGKIGAAGGILSTVTDMFKWNEALKSGIILKREILQQAFTPQKLLDGSFTNYGFGWYLEELHGSPTRRHGGMVPGYTSETLYLPNEDVYVVFFTNTEISTIPITALTRIIAGIMIGKPYIFDSKPIDKNLLKQYTGIYENSYNEVINIIEQNDYLVFQRPNGNPYNLGYAGNNEFFFYKDFYRINFETNSNKKITSLKFSKADVSPTEWIKTEKTPLKLATGRINDSILNAYVGKYFLNNSDSIEISRDGVNLNFKSGKDKLLLAAADNTHFFTLQDDLNITFLKNPKSNTWELLLTKNKISKKYLKLSSNITSLQKKVITTVLFK